MLRISRPDTSRPRARATTISHDLRGQRNRVSLVGCAEYCESRGMRGAFLHAPALRPCGLKIFDRRSAGIHPDFSCPTLIHRNATEGQIG